MAGARQTPSRGNQNHKLIEMRQTDGSVRTNGGRLVAKGSPASMITFDESSTGNAWGGFVFWSGATSTVTTSPPYTPDYSAGSVLEWCRVSHAGAGNENGYGTRSGAILVKSGGPAIVNSAIISSLSNGIVFDNAVGDKRARAILLDSSVQTNAESGIVFPGNNGKRPRFFDWRFWRSTHVLVTWVCTRCHPQHRLLLNLPVVCANQQ